MADLGRRGHIRPVPPRRARTAFRRTLIAGRDALANGLDNVLERIEHAAEPVQDAVEEVAAATQTGAHAIAETAERAAHAPKDIAREVRKELQATTEGLGRMLVLGSLLAIAGSFALVLLTIGAVIALNLLLGAPWGQAIVGVIYVVAAALLARALLAARREMQEKQARHAEHLREEVGEVVEPAREALENGRDGAQVPDPDSTPEKQAYLPENAQRPP